MLTPAPTPGSFAEFLADLRRSLTVARQVPWLPVLELALVLLLASANHLGAVDPESISAGFVTFLATVFYLSMLGWLGAQRLVFRAVMVGAVVNLADVPGMVKDQGWRFVKLAGLLVPAAAVVLAITVVFTDDLLSEMPEVSPLGHVLAAMVTIGIGVALTLVTPALAFETDSAREAWRKGWERLRDHRVASRWHATLPPLVFAVAPIVAVGFDGPWALAVALGSSMVTFIARGGVVALHLRIRDHELAAMPPPAPVVL